MSSHEDSLAKKVQSSYQKLSVAAADLNKVSDELGRSVAELDAALKKLNLGITVWTNIRGNEDDQGSYWSEEIGYAKIDGKWGIALRTVSGNYGWPEQDRIDQWLFNDAPRSMRISAIGKIPGLMEAMSKEAAESTKNIRAKLAEAQEVASAVKVAAEEKKSGGTQREGK